MEQKTILKPDAETLGRIYYLGESQATLNEVALDFEITGDELKASFECHPILERTFERAKAESLIELRRNQFKLAKDNVNMAIWLGKQYLNQRDINER